MNNQKSILNLKDFKDNPSLDVALLTESEIEQLTQITGAQASEIEGLRREIESIRALHSSKLTMNGDLMPEKEKEISMLFKSLTHKRNKLNELIEFEEAVKMYKDLYERIEKLDKAVKQNKKDKDGYLCEEQNPDSKRQVPAENVYDEMLILPIKKPLLLYRKIQTNYAGWQVLSNSTKIICSESLSYFKQQGQDLYIDPLTKLDIKAKTTYSSPDNPKLHGCRTVYKIVEFSEIKDCRELMELAVQLREKLKSSLKRSNLTDSFFSQKADKHEAMFCADNSLRC